MSVAYRSETIKKSMLKLVVCVIKMKLRYNGIYL